MYGQTDGQRQIYMPPPIKWWGHKNMDVAQLGIVFISSVNYHKITLLSQQAISTTFKSPSDSDSCYLTFLTSQSSNSQGLH
jgi:hypothetical protein